MPCLGLSRIGFSRILAPLPLVLTLGGAASAQTAPGPSDPLAPTLGLSDPASPAAPGVTEPARPAPGRNVTATGKTMPPAGGRAPAGGPIKPSTEAEMIKAQKAAEERNKAWDAKMRKTMGSICSGC